MTMLSMSGCLVRRAGFRRGFWTGVGVIEGSPAGQRVN